MKNKQVWACVLAGKALTDVRWFVAKLGVILEEGNGQSIITLIKSPEATKTIEKFYAALKQKHPQNTCRNVTNSAIQFLK